MKALIGNGTLRITELQAVFIEIMSKECEKYHSLLLDGLSILCTFHRRYMKLPIAKVSYRHISLKLLSI
jgi:hypothetical protein